MGARVHRRSVVVEDSRLDYREDMGHCDLQLLLEGEGSSWFQGRSENHWDAQWKAEGYHMDCSYP